MYFFFIILVFNQVVGAVKTAFSYTHLKMYLWGIIPSEDQCPCLNCNDIWMDNKRYSYICIAVIVLCLEPFMVTVCLLVLKCP